MQVIKTGWKKYRLHSFTGKVTGMGKDVVMFTFGQNRKTPVNGKGGWLPAVNIETTTNAFNHVFLTAGNGSERSLHLKSFDIACREGHELTAIWAVKQGEERGPYIAILNNTTRQAFFAYNEIAKMFTAPSLLYILVIPGSFFTAYFFSHETITAISAILPGFLMIRIFSVKISGVAAKKFIARLRIIK